MAARVLIVDDDRSFRRMAAQLLRVRGFEVAGEARGEREAVAAIERLRPDGVLLDLHLPDGNGFEIAGRLSGLEPSPRILLTSSDADAASPDLAERCGAVGFAAKAELAAVDLKRYFSPSA